MIAFLRMRQQQKKEEAEKLKKQKEEQSDEVSNDGSQSGSRFQLFKKGKTVVEKPNKKVKK